MTITPSEFIDLVKDVNKPESKFRFATVDPNYLSGRPQLIFDGETIMSQKKYPYLSSYIPAANDRVFLIKTSAERAESSYLIIGKVI